MTITVTPEELKAYESAMAQYFNKRFLNLVRVMTQHLHFNENDLHQLLRKQAQDESLQPPRLLPSV